MDYDTRHTTVVADDGRKLDVTVHEPAEPRGVVLLVGAMATPSSFYAPFADHLATNGFRALRFDYRDTESIEAMKDSMTDIDQWARDTAAILDTAFEEAGDLPVSWVAHSLGGQILPFADHSRLSRILTVASGSGYWGLNTPRTRALAPLLWFGIAPVTTRLFGYFAGSRIGVLGDVPTGAMRQWGRWCRHRGYLEVDHPEAPRRFAAVTTPIRAVSIGDDELLSKAAIDDLHARYTGTEVERVEVDPASYGHGRIGHHGFFRARNAALWDALVLPWIT